MIEVCRLGSQIGAEIQGVNVKTLDDASFAVLYRAWLDRNVLVVRGQEDLQIEDFLRYSRRFGLVHPHPSKMTRHSDYPEITLLGVSKFRPDGTLDLAIYRRGGESWHTDGAYDQERTATGSPSSIRSSAPTPRRGARRSTSIPARSCASRVWKNKRATR